MEGFGSASQLQYPKMALLQLPMLPVHCTSNKSGGVLLGALCALCCSMQFAIVESNTGHEH